MSSEAQCIHPDQTDGQGSGRSAIILIAAALMAIGLVMVGSATSSLDGSLLAPRFWTTAFGRQACFVVVGLAICVGTGWVSRGVLASDSATRWIARCFYGLAIVLLMLVLVPGLSDASHGSQRWLRFSLGGVAAGLQPSEVAKLALIAFLAYRLGCAKSDPRSFFRGFIPAAGAILLCCGLVGKENFGTAALLVAVAFVMLLVGGCRYHHLFLMVGAATSGLVGLLLAEPYRLARLTAYQDIWSDAQGAGYQPLQSLTTIASGGWWGVGLGSGLQKYGYLPESHTDFIFAVIAEEGGRLWLKPVDKRDRKDTLISDLGGAQVGDLVLAEKSGRPPRITARVQEVLGDPFAPRAFSLIAIHKFDIPNVFSVDLLAEAEKVAGWPIIPPRNGEGLYARTCAICRSSRSIRPTHATMTMPSGQPRPRAGGSMRLSRLPMCLSTSATVR